MYNIPKNSKTQNLTLIQDMVKFNGPTKSQLYLKFKRKIFHASTLNNFIFRIDKKIGKLYIFWNTLSPTLTTNTGSAINTLTTNTGLAINTLTMNKACLTITYNYMIS